MFRKLAIAISVVMHPLLMPTILFALLFYYAPAITKPFSYDAARYILLALFITTFVLPMVSIVALRLSSLLTMTTTTDKLAALSMPERKDRILPFFFTSMFYAITTYMFFYKFQVSQVLVIILAATTLIIIITSFISLFLKISTHSVSAGSLIGFLIGLGIKYPHEQMVYPLVLILLLGGMVMSARLYLNEHRPVDILVGSAVGLGVSLVGILIFVP